MSTTETAISRFIEVKKLTDDQIFWSENPPDEVIIATGSIRKSVMAIKQIENFSFEVFQQGELIKITEPMELQDYFNKYIFNGNGALEEKTFLGYLHGVEVYAEPSEGETASNANPYQEAVNKVMDLYEKYKDEDKRVLILSTDTVDKPDSADSPLGKPANEPDFPSQDQFTKDEAFDKEGYEIAVTKYLEDFKIKFYTASKEIIHTNAVVILDTATGILINLGHKFHNIELTIEINKKMLASAEANPYMGGGGITQQLVEWDNPEAVKSYFSEFVQKLLDDETDEVMKMALFCQISGMPYAIIELLRLSQAELVAIKKVEGSISLLEDEEVDKYREGIELEVQKQFVIKEIEENTAFLKNPEISIEDFEKADKKIQENRIILKKIFILIEKLREENKEEVTIYQAKAENS